MMTSKEGIGLGQQSVRSDAPIDLPTVSNFRDFGGYQTTEGRQVPAGKLFRSAHLGRIDGAGVRKMLGLGIRTVVDLRGKDERTKALPTGEGISEISIVSAPVEPGSFQSMVLADGRVVTAELMRENIIATYRRFGTDAALGFGVALNTVLQGADEPILVHCTAGKDRTGFTVALIQLLLGVSRDDVMQDYLLTNSRWDRAYEGASRFPPEVMAPGLLADESYLGTALNSVDREHGGIAQFAAKATGRDDFADRLKRALLRD